MALYFSNDVEHGTTCSHLLQYLRVPSLLFAYGRSINGLPFYVIIAWH